MGPNTLHNRLTKFLRIFEGVMIGLFYKLCFEFDFSTCKLISHMDATFTSSREIPVFNSRPQANLQVRVSATVTALRTTNCHPTIHSFSINASPSLSGSQGALESGLNAGLRRGQDHRVAWRRQTFARCTHSHTIGDMPSCQLAKCACVWTVGGVGSAGREKPD